MQVVFKDNEKYFTGFFKDNSGSDNPRAMKHPEELKAAMQVKWPRLELAWAMLWATLQE